MQAGLMEINATLIIQLINVLITYLILRSLLFKPVTAFMENRRKGIEDSIQEAIDKNNEADRLKAEYEAKIREINQERNEIIQEAGKRAQERSAEIISAAEEEAKKIKARALAEIEQERQRVAHELRNELSHLSVSIAAKVIQKDLNQQDHEALIQQFIDKAGEVKWQN